MCILYKIRKENNLLQKDIAKILNVESHTYSQYERNIRAMPIECYIQLAEYYGCTVDYLVGHSIMPNSLDKRLDPDYSEMVSLWNKMDKHNKMRTLGYMQGLVGQQENNNQKKTLNIIDESNINNNAKDFDRSNKKSLNLFEK